MTTIAELELELDQVSQSLTDSITANSVAITVARQIADGNTIDVAEALSQVYSAELGAKTYTDAEIQKIRDELGLTITSSIDASETTLLDLLIIEINNRIASNDTNNTSTLASLTALRDEIQGITNNATTAIDGFMLNELPGLNASIANAELVAATVSQDLTNLVDQYSYPTLEEGFNDVRAGLEADIAPIGTPDLKLPRSLWGLNVDEPNTNVEKFTLGLYGLFQEADADFGFAFEFTDGADRNIGPSYPIHYDPNKVYKLEIELKCIDNGTDGLGAKVTVGATVNTGTTQLYTTEANWSPGRIQIASGVRRKTYYASGNPQKMIDYGIVASERIDLSPSGGGNKLYVHVGQNSGGANSGRLSVGSIAVTDVTEVLDGVNAVLVELQSEIDGVNATLTDTYMTAVDTNAAIALNRSELKAEIEDPLGSSLGATLDQQYYTSVETDSAISAATLALKGEIEDPLGTSLGATLETNYYTSVEADSAISAATTSLKAEIEDPNGTSLGADLTNNYYTSTETDSSIAAADSALKAAIEDPLGSSVGANLNINHYTKTETDSAISAEITTLKSDIEDPAGSSLGATLENNYFTSTETNSAISAATTTLKSQIEDPLGTSLGADLANNYYTILDADSAIAAADNALKAAIEDPNGSSLGATLDQNYYTVAGTDSAISSADNALKAAIEDPLGSSLGATLDQNYLTSTATNQAIASEISTLKSEIEDPNGTSLGATLNNNYYTSVDTDSAISGEISSYDASIAGGISASVTSHTAAIAEINGFQSATYTIRLKAGGVANEVEFVAADDPINGATSSVRFSADTVLFDGTIVAAKVDTASFSSSGLSIFNGVLGSDDFVSGTSGWQIQKSGNAEFNQLIVRESLVPGSVTDGYSTIVNTEADGDRTFSSGSLPNSEDHVWIVSGILEIRNAVSGQPAFAFIEARTLDGGVWGAWETIASTTVTNTTYEFKRISGLYKNRGTNAELRFRVEETVGVVFSKNIDFSAKASVV